MSTRIRLRKIGRKKLPLYRIVVADKESPRDGRFIEILGTYDPKQEGARDRGDVERRRAGWPGSHPTDTVERRSSPRRHRRRPKA